MTNKIETFNALHKILEEIFVFSSISKSSGGIHLFTKLYIKEKNFEINHKPLNKKRKYNVTIWKKVKWFNNFDKMLIYIVFHLKVWSDTVWYNTPYTTINTQHVYYIDKRFVNNPQKLFNIIEENKEATDDKQ